MKNEVITIRVDEKTKLKLLQQSQYYNTTLSRFMLDITEKACNLDVIQVWIHAYIDYVIKYNRTATITHYKLDTGDCAWSVPAFENTYFSRIELLETLQGCVNYDFNVNLPRMWEVLDQWDEFVRRLNLLGMWEERDE